MHILLQLWQVSVRQILLCLVALISLSNAVAAQVPLSHYYQDHWSTREGLPHNTINAITQTAEGYLWFATWEGAARYNGHSFRSFTRGEQTGLPDSGLRNLINDGAGVFAVGARGGISRYENQQWTGQVDASAMVNHVLRTADNKLWLATEGEGIYVRDSESTIAHFNVANGLPSNDVYRLIQDNAGHIWVATAAGLARIEQSTVHIIPELSGVSVWTLLLDKQQRILIGSGQGLYVVEQAEQHTANPQSASLQAANPQSKPQPQIELPAIRALYPELAQHSIISLLQDNKEDLWLGTTDRGLLRISSLGIEQLTVAEGLPEQRVVSLFQDHEDSIWVGTNGGLMRLRDVPFTSYTEQDGLAGNYARSVLAHSDGSVWVGSSTGLSQIKDDQVISLPLMMADGTPPSILSLAEGSAHELWVGTFSHGLLQLVAGKIVAIYGRGDGLPSNEIRAILPTQDGSVWVGTAAGLSQFSQGVFKRYGLNSGVPGEFIMSLYQGVNNDIWVGTGTGAAIIDQATIARSGTMTAVYLNSQENAEYAFGFYAEPNGDYVWLATDRGLLRYRYADASLALVGSKHGLPVEKIFQPIADQQGGLWLTTNKGILRLNLAQAHRIADGQQSPLIYEHFDEGDGMRSSQANGGSGPAGVLAIDGSVWVATALGVTTVAPARVTALANNHLPVVVEAMEVAGQAEPITSDLQLPPGSSRVLFRFAGLGFVLPERIQYRTLLAGFDKDWVVRGQQNTAEYTNLAPGDYIFKVAAAYPYSDWGPEEASVAFTVLPFIWQRAFFWPSIVAMLLAALWLALRFRLRMLEYQATELQRQVKEQTHALRLQAQAFELQAREDALTGLPNRRAFDESLARALARAQRDHLPVSLIILDIDHFKQVNDGFSHAVGDQVIKVVAELIRQEIREIDTPARWGGEEFTVLLPNTDANSALHLAQRLRTAVMNYDFAELAPQLRLTVSMGVAQLIHLETEHQLLANADHALYLAKHQGRNRVVVFNSESQ